MIAIRTEDTVTIISIAGRIDANTTAEIEQALQPLIEKENYLILDLSQCPYLSSVGIRTLLKTEKVLKPKGGGLLLCGLSPEVFQILEMAGMLQLFRVFTNLEECQNELKRLMLLAGESRKWVSGEFSFEFSPIENKRQPALLWNGQGIAGYNELGFSVGIGSPAESPEEEKEARGIFISNGHCAGFIPDNSAMPDDFRIPQNPGDAGIFVNQALSFGHQPMGIIRLAVPASLSLAQLAEALYPLNEQDTYGETAPVSLVIANFDSEKPTLSLLLVVDPKLNNVLEEYEFPGIQHLAPTIDAGLRLWGARFILSDIQKTPAGISLSHFLKNILTIENILGVEVIHQDDQLVNPVTWLFISEGISEASSLRLKIETEDNLILEPHKTFLARRLYTDSNHLVIKQIHGGYSAQTFQVTSFDHKGRKLRPTVLKIADRAMISRESDRCKRYANPYILNNSAMVLGTEFFGNTGALRYNFVGIGGEQTQLKWLTHYFHNWPAEQLEPLFDKIFLQILHPWYGQPIHEVIHPFSDHDPRSTFFPQLCEIASNELCISPDEQFFTVKEIGRQLVNPYWFLKHEFVRRRETEINYYTSICHGDLNMQNILLDEDMNVYLIDFSETKPRSVISDFARLEAIFMVDNAPLHDPKETEAYLKFISGFYGTVRLDQVPVVNYVEEHPDQVSKNVALTIKMREYAFKSVNQNTDPVPYCIALLEWIMPIVCYSSASIEHKRLSMIVSGLICENLINRL